MRVKPWSPSVSFIIGLLLTPVMSATAQDTPPLVNPPAEDEPERVTMANFGALASEVENRLSAIEVDLETLDISEAVPKALDEIEGQGEALEERFSAFETRRMMSSEINRLSTDLKVLQARTTRQIERLGSRAKDLTELAEQNSLDIEVWEQAVRESRDSPVPKDVRARAGDTLKELRRAQAALEKKLSSLLAVQSRALEVLDRINRVEELAEMARKAQARGVFERQDPPLWESAREKPAKEEDETTETSGKKQEGYGVGLTWPSMTEALRRSPKDAVIYVGFLLVVGLILRRTRRLLTERIDKRQQKGPIHWEDSAAEAVRHPWGSALIVGVAALPAFYPDRMIEAVILTWVVIIPVWYFVVRRMVPAGFDKPLLGLAFLGTLHVALVIITGQPIVERTLLLVELILATMGAAWMIRYFRVVEVPKHVRQSFWFGASRAWTQLVLVMSVTGIFGTILGYQHLGEETAILAVLATIAATAWAALARIVEAVVATAIHRGRLDVFRMIRANRDLTSNHISRAIRLFAAVWFIFELSQMFSLWQPVGEIATTAVRSDLGLGFIETGVTFVDLLGFFFILWLSWLLARLVSFLLREELLPRLDMKPGVPYALTTFTRYAIIAIGFIAAIAVLGISLDRVTIVLSALGVGIGFGLQSLVNNFVSGFVLLTERPIRLRDKVEVQGVLGNVSSIGMRATSIRTFDGAEVIVPNGDLVSQQLVNWTLSARRQRVTIPVGVAYGSDPSQVLAILRRVADDDKKVFDDPAPLALLRGFGESSLDFELRVFMDPSDVLDVPSALCVAIYEALHEASITIPLPQRDLHLRSMPESGTLPFDLPGEPSDEPK